MLSGTSAVGGGIGLLHVARIARKKRLVVTRVVIGEVGAFTVFAASIFVAQVAQHIFLASVWFLW